MRWLHLSDLHVGKNDQSRDLALASLISAINNNNNGKKIDLVILTGDIAYSGSHTQYADVVTNLLDPIKNLPGFESSKIIVIPGNHDMDCEATLHLDWEKLSEQKQNLFFQSTPEGLRIRAPRAAAFKNFSEFKTRNKYLGLDPLLDSGSNEIVEIDSKKFGLIFLNTALLSDKDFSDEEKTPAPTLALQFQMQNLSEVDQIVVFGHHPIEWFIHRTISPFRTALADARAIYLHGHLHEIKCHSSQQGLESLGFGASYLKPLNSEADSLYKNNFAICHLDAHLHVAFYCWDNNNGRWIAEKSLPVDFDTQSILVNNGYRLLIPSKKGRSQKIIKDVTPDISNITSKITSLTCLETPTFDQWIRLLNQLNISISHRPQDFHSSSKEDGSIEIRENHSKGERRYRCIPGLGHIISEREVETENTKFDTQDISYSALISLGDIESPAKILALQIAQKKSLKIITNSDLVLQLLQNLTQSLKDRILEFEGERCRLDLLMLQEGIGLVAIESLRQEWFSVFDQNGLIYQESDSTVRRIREINKNLLASRYRSSNQKPANLIFDVSGTQPFDRTKYLSLCQEEFDSLKYAPLASLGFKFPTTRLRDVYVPASAEIVSEGSENGSLKKRVEEILNEMPIDEKTKEMLINNIPESQMGSAQVQSGSAKELYKSNRVVLLTGDPGSGKTCFVKNEILNYCNPSNDDHTWYQIHLPIFIPLSELPQHFEEGVDFLESCVSITNRRGLPLNYDQLITMINNGKAAFFFDGLDEVVSIENRIKISKEISKLIEETSSIGNRFVVTSRPAAVEPVELPPKMKRLHLRGLNKIEMKSLAQKILAMQVVESGTKVGIVEAVNMKQDNLIVDRLIADCEEKPGIGLLAQNPLLLTLLTMVYANSGALSAKKHRIYGQAVSTLVSVRNRQTFQSVLSETDLRVRLGEVALRIFENRIPENPTKNQVIEIFSSFFKKSDPASARDKAISYLQQIAESTGLLVIRQAKSQADDDTVSFMHYSFLEYYAATRLLAKNDIKAIESLAEEKRWQEVISLVAGLIGDHANVEPLILALMDSKNLTDKITQNKLLFAFDCALECDVPPERIQEELISSTMQVMSCGQGKVDGEIRKQLASRLKAMFESTGSPILLNFFQEGLTHEDKSTKSAFIDLSGRVFSGVAVPNIIKDLVLSCCKDDDTSVKISIIGAISRSKDLRTEETVSILKEAFHGSFPLKLSASNAVIQSLELAQASKESLIYAVNDAQKTIATLCSRALLNAELGNDILSQSNRFLIDSCLRNISFLSHRDGVDKYQIHIQKEELSPILTSPYAGDRIFALRLLPWIRRDEQYVHSRLFEILTANTTGEEVKAALIALRLTFSSIGLSSASQKERLIYLLSQGDADIRSEVAKTLSVFEFDENILRSLLTYASNSKPKELRSSIKALALFAPNHLETKRFITRILKTRLNQLAQGNFSHRKNKVDEHKNLVGILKVCQDLDLNDAIDLDELFIRVIDNYKTPKDIRVQALRTFPATAKLTAASTKQILVWFSKLGEPYSDNIGFVTIAFILRLKKKAHCIKLAYNELPDLLQKITERWLANGPDRTTEIENHNLQSFRRATAEINDILKSYAEYKEPTKQKSEISKI